MVGGWLELDFSVLECQATDTQEGKVKMNHMVLEHHYEFMFILKYIEMNGCRNTYRYV